MNLDHSFCPSSAYCAVPHSACARHPNKVIPFRDYRGYRFLLVVVVWIIQTDLWKLDQHSKCKIHSKVLEKPTVLFQAHKLCPPSSQLSFYKALLTNDSEETIKASHTKTKVADLCNSACILVVWLSLKITLFVVYAVNNSQAPVCSEWPPWDGESSA